MVNIIQIMYLVTGIFILGYILEILTEEDLTIPQKLILAAIVIIAFAGLSYLFKDLIFRRFIL